MGAAIGASLPYAIAAAASPIPVTAVILMLVTRRSGGSSLSFSLARLFGYTVILAAVIAGAEVIGRGSASERSLLAVVGRIVMGAVTLGAGIWSWLAGRRKGSGNGLWKRVRALDRIGPTRSAGFGLALSIGPNSLFLLIGGGVAIGSAVIDPGAATAAAAVFLALATSTVLVPIVLYYALGAHALAVLEPLEQWIEAHHVVTSAVVLVVVGAGLLGAGIIELRH